MKPFLVIAFIVGIYAWISVGNASHQSQSGPHAYTHHSASHQSQSGPHTYTHSTHPSHSPRVLLNTETRKPTHRGPDFDFRKTPKPDVKITFSDGSDD